MKNVKEVTIRLEKEEWTKALDKAFNNKKKDLKGMTASIILFSIFVLSWIPINISVFVKKYNKWEAIKHTRSIKIDDIKK